MNRALRSAIVAAAVTAALAWSPSGAAAIQKPFQIGIGGGVSVPVSDAGNALKNGWHATGILRFNLPGSPIDVRGLFSYKHFALDPSSLGYGGTGQILSGLGNLTFTMPVPGPIKPYLTAGVGAFKLKSNPDPSSAPSSESDYQFGIDAGAGIQFGFMGLTGFAEGKFESIYTNEGWNPALTQDLKTQVIPVTFGIFF